MTAKRWLYEEETRRLPLTHYNLITHLKKNRAELRATFVQQRDEKKQHRKKNHTVVA